MNFNYCFKSDIGTTRESNQDSVYANVVKTSSAKAFMGLVCDGMGGLANGKLASQTVADAFCGWFENRFSENISSEAPAEYIFSEWDSLITDSNNTLIEMSKSFGEQMGTTLSVLLIYNGEYYAAQVGDSRIYRLTNGSAVQVTKDHSYVMEMVSKGMMTETEARLSKERNVLTRCIGAVSEVRGDLYNGTVLNGDTFLITSDGFHGRQSPEDIRGVLTELSTCRHGRIEKKLTDLIEFRKKNGEKDNITALVVTAKL